MIVKGTVLPELVEAKCCHILCASPLQGHDRLLTRSKNRGKIKLQQGTPGIRRRTGAKFLTASSLIDPVLNPDNFIG